MVLACMGAKNKPSRPMRRIIITFVFLPILALFLACGLTTKPVHAAPYGECNYNANSYNSSNSCATIPNSPTDASEPGSLSATGQNYIQLVYAGIGLLAFGVGTGFVIYLIARKRPKTTL